MDDRVRVQFPVPGTYFDVQPATQGQLSRVFIPVSDFSFPGIGNGKMSFPGIPGIPGMQGVIQ